jgi:CPA2 family monovalent cation:H+ antiporter-2
MKIIFAAGASPPFFTEAATMVAAGALVAYICQRLRLVPIVGFLLAGVLIGPNALGLVRDREMVDAAAEVGVILLLFTIGIEFSLDRLARIRRLIFGGGSLQVGLAALLTTGLLSALGAGWRAALFTGFLVALSSTAIVLKVLADKGETGDTHGQVALGLLIFQDLAIVVMVLLVPTLGGAGGSGLGIVWALAKAAAIIAAVLLFARRVMPKLLEAVARTCSPEIFLLTVIAICFGTAYLTSLAGVSLSLGAFLAGLLVSESRFSEHAFGEILPLQIIFSAFFFISVGMLLDVGFLFRNLPLVAATVALVLAVKFLTTGASVLALGYRAPVAAASGLALAQVGEFSFVLERAGRDAGLSPGGTGEVGSQTFIASTVVLMVLTPLLMQAGSKLARKIEERHNQGGAASEGAAADDGHLAGVEDHVIVAGYGQAARRLVRVLSGSRIPYVISTLSPEGANEAEGEGRIVLRGDAGRQRTLQLAGVERAKMVVVADDEPAAARRIATVARTLNPTARILVRTRYMEDVERLTEAGADRAVAEELESVVALFGDVLRGYQIPAAEIDAHEEAIRRGGYAALLRDRAEGERPVVVCSPGQDCFDTRTVTVRAGSPVTKRPLARLALDTDFGITVREVIRGGEILPDPPEDFVPRPGDEVVLEGPTDAFTRAAHLFRAGGAESAEAGEDAEPASAGGADVDTEHVVRLDVESLSKGCGHLPELRPVFPSARGCEECLRAGDTWVHLRLCMTCGHVGCCDSSKNKHASKHYPATGHPIVKSLERNEDWVWCYPDETYL